MERKIVMKQENIINSEPKALFSVVVLHYKQLKYWEESVQSVLRQDYPAIQLVFADDATPEFPIQSVKEYIENNKHENLRSYIICRNELNAGTAENCDKALQYCEGEYILFLDGDDILAEPDVISNFVHIFDKLPKEERIVSANAFVCDADLTPKGIALSNEKCKMENRLAGKEQYKRLYCDFWPVPSSTAYRKEIFTLFGGFRVPHIRLCQDGYYFIHITRMGQHIHAENFVASYHREGGVTHPCSHAASRMPSASMRVKGEFLRIAEMEIFPFWFEFCEKEKEAIVNRYYENLVTYGMTSKYSKWKISEPAFSIMSEWIQQKALPCEMTKSKLDFSSQVQKWTPFCNQPVRLADEENQCCGCSACQAICPQKAISMKEDKKGFLYPVIQKEFCIQCGRCRAVCPINEPKEGAVIPETYLAIKHKSKLVREKSRSGGAFYAMARNVIRKNGVVYGATYDENLSVKHIRVDIESELSRLQGSKYVQSDLQDSFELVKNDLHKGRQVLFSGTPCQGEGLFRYLSKKGINTSKLYLLDLVCHGVASPKIYREYLNDVESRYQCDLIDFNFRDKSIGWRACQESMSCFEENETRKHFSSDFATLFCHDLISREICYQCPYSCYEHIADITIGDFWGIEKVIPEIDDNKGISLVMTRTEKGRELLRSSQRELKIWTVQKKDTEQPSLVRSATKGEGYTDFWDQFLRYGIEPFVQKTKEDALNGTNQKEIHSVGILTFHRAHNYGAMLQAWALMKVLQNSGYDVRLIDYRCNSVEKLYRFIPWQVIPRFGNFNRGKAHLIASIKEYGSSVKSILPVILIWWKRRHNFNTFLRNQLKVKGFGKKVIQGIPCDAIICGSDQIWATQDAPYYAAFNTKARKIAYAPSIGNGTFPPEQHPTICKWIQDFDFLSVREKYFAEYLQAVFGVPEPQIVLDPTLLLTENEYLRIIDRQIAKKPFIFVYAVLENDLMVEVAQRVADQIGCDLIILHGFLRMDVPQEQDAEAGPEKFLWYVKNAVTVFTNSFHGVAFSLLFHTPFYCVYREGENSRIDNLIDIAGVKNRHIYNMAPFIEESIDWNMVDSRLEKKRKESMEFLHGALS